MGRSMLPEKVKALSSTLRADRSKEGIQFELLTEIPKPEVWLSAKGKKNFKSLAGLLLEKSLLYNSDIHLVSILAEEMATYEMACRKLKSETDYVMKTPKGYEQQSPWVGIRNQAQNNVRSIGSQFGLDPLSREKFGGPKTKEGKNPFEEL